MTIFTSIHDTLEVREVIDFQIIATLKSTLSFIKYSWSQHLRILSGLDLFSKLSTMAGIMMVCWVFCGLLSFIYIARFITSQYECLMTCNKSSMVTICVTEAERTKNITIENTISLLSSGDWRFSAFSCWFLGTPTKKPPEVKCSSHLLINQQLDQLQLHLLLPNPLAGSVY